MKHYSQDTTKHRQKRSKEYKDYSSLSTKSIPNESYFPNYWQHTTEDDCYVGCGPVAWAMIFGYYDRRSHYMSSTYGTGSQGLYRCDSDGASGSNSCIAPSSSSSDVSRMKKYLEKIARNVVHLKSVIGDATSAVCRLRKYVSEVLHAIPNCL